MTTKIGDLCVAIRSYTNSNGEKRNVYENIGSKFQNDDGGFFYRLKRHINYSLLPVSDGGDIIVREFSIQKERTPEPQNLDVTQDFSNIDDVPF